MFSESPKFIGHAALDAYLHETDNLPARLHEAAEHGASPTEKMSSIEEMVDSLDEDMAAITDTKLLVEARKASIGDLADADKVATASPAI